MEVFSNHFDTLQAAILSKEVDDNVGQICQCHNAVRLYRCMDCLFPPVLCSSCIKDSHATNPFHRIQKWNGCYFDRATLTELRQVIGVGHGGAFCPNRLPESKGRATTVVHTNGIHQIRIEYCHCVNAPAEYEQLAKASLFPATVERPETTFTFQVLKEFHNLSLSSKIPAYDFINALANMTNNAFPGKVPDCYRQFLRVERIWRHLATLRRSGQAHGIDGIISHRRSNSLAVRCPACPEPGFNIEPVVIQNASEDETHKYTLFLSVDGNFRLQRKKKRDDLDDVAVNKGNAYFADSADFNKYLAHVRPKDDVRYGFISLGLLNIYSCSWALVHICEPPVCKTL
ncbi:hypothetical protein F5887DRAFT_899624 [Amanita rubescens]|nr:hypothetical protein F5887DRAFT_899624 [Amanita rubescens]